MADPQQSSSEERLNKAEKMDKDHTLHPTASGSSENDETIAPLPPSEVMQTTTSMAPQKTSSTLQSARGKLGLHPIAPVADEHDTAEHSDLLWPKIRLSLKEPFAEFWGTFFLVLFGDGSVAQVLLSTNQKTAPGGDGFGSYQSINWGWGLGVMLGIYIAGDSGAYLKYVLK
jgi:aquaglyceroporin related protein